MPRIDRLGTGCYLGYFPILVEVHLFCFEVSLRRFLRLLAFDLRYLKGPSQPPPFSMPSKLLILHGEAKSEFFIIGCAPESVFNYL